VTPLEWAVYAQQLAIVGLIGFAYFTRRRQYWQDKRADLHLRRINTLCDRADAQTRRLDAQTRILEAHSSRLDSASAMLQRIDGQVDRLEQQVRELVGDGK
jgi:hypothetical protein